MSDSTDEHMFGEEDDLDAAEYALGVLDEPERLERRGRVASDPEFARAVEGWEARLGALTEEAAAIAPPAQVWTAIERRLGGDGAVIELRLRRDLGLWRGAAAAAAVIAVSLAGALAWRRSAPVSVQGATPAILSARLTAPRGDTLFVAVLDPQRRQIVLTPAAIAAAPGKSPELWLIPASGRPVPLGVAAFRHSVRLRPGVRLADTAPLTLAVSMEPEGGSPTGQPTGPVIATGRTEAL